MSEGEPTDPYQPPLQNEPPPAGSESHLPLITGTYFTILGWCSLAFVIFTIIRTDQFHFNISFLIWLWLGFALRKKIKIGRICAIIVFWAVFVMSLLVLNNRLEVVTLGPFIFPGNSSPAYLIQGAYLLIFGLPGIFLMTPLARRAFQGEDEPS